MRIIPSLIMAMSFLCGSARATPIILVDDGTVAGSRAEEAFKVAADFWSARLTNPTPIIIKIGFVRINGTAIGTTENREIPVSVARWERAVQRTKSSSAIDASIVLPALKRGAFRADFAGPAARPASRTLMLNASLVKALGLKLPRSDAPDAEIKLNAGYAFDFDPTDGMVVWGVDAVAVVIHEMGHVLGFGSGVDKVDAVAGAAASSDILASNAIYDEPLFSPLDMFRYSRAQTLALAPGADAYFSIDGGKSALMGAKFATGIRMGDGNQAGHFKDVKRKCTVSFGVMDPGSCGGSMWSVTGADLAAFDAMGWNLDVDALSFKTVTTADLVRAYRAKNAEKTKP
jgi:hypothetical protein